MPFVAIFWLALLHALSVAAPVRPADAVARPRAHVQRAVAGERRHVPHPSRAPEEALRAASGGGATALSRSGGPTPRGGAAPAAALPGPAWPPAATSDARRALQRHGAESHALAARGRLLPYYPTAPPLAG